MFSACTHSTENEVVFQWDINIENPFYGETLTVAVFGCALVSSLADAYMRANRGVTIEVVHMVNLTDARRPGFNYSHALSIARERMRMQLLARDAPLLIHSNLVNWQCSDFFADWLPLIESHPGFSKDEWFLSVFYAMADENGVLLAFPPSISFYYVSANTKVPGLADLFASMDSITMRELVAIYYAFGGLNTGLYMIPSDFVVWDALWFQPEFVDFPRSHVDFLNINFVALLEAVGRSTKPIPQSTRIDSSREDARFSLAKLFMFSIDSPTHLGRYGEFYGGAAFANALPLVNEDRDLLVHPISQEKWSLNVTATYKQQALALDFLRFMQDNTISEVQNINSRLRFLWQVYINKARFEHHATEIIQLDLGRGDLQKACEVSTVLVLERIAGEMERTMARLPHVPDSFRSFFAETIEHHRLGLITAQEAAARLQNRAVLQIMEGN